MTTERQRADKYTSMVAQPDRIPAPEASKSACVGMIDIRVECLVKKQYRFVYYFKH